MFFVLFRIKLFYFPAQILLVLMSLSFLSGDSLEVAHVGRVDGVADKAQVVDLGHFLATLKRFKNVIFLVENINLFISKNNDKRNEC